MHCSNGIGEGSSAISHALRRAIPSEDARSTWWGDRRGRAIVLRRLQHLRANPDRHGALFRDIERGLDAERMATSRSNAKNFVGSVEAMLDGTLPTTKSAGVAVVALLVAERVLYNIGALFTASSEAATCKP
jgi:hypothetical protein